MTPREVIAPIVEQFRLMRHPLTYTRRLIRGVRDLFDEIWYGL